MDIVQILIVIGIIVFAAIKKLNDGGDREDTNRQKPVKWPIEDEEATDRRYIETPAESHFSYDRNYSPPPSEPRRTTKISPPASPPVKEESENNSDFNIQSAEEARRAIVWSEILNRKY